LLILAICGLWVSLFPWEDPAQMTAKPARGRFSRRKALLNIGGLFALGGASGYLFTLLQTQTQRAIAMRFQLKQPAYAIDPFGANRYLPNINCRESRLARERIKAFPSFPPWREWESPCVYVLAS
jgi:hypothetical protein